MMARRRVRLRTPKRKRSSLLTSRLLTRSTTTATRTSSALTTATQESAYVHHYLSALGCSATVSGVSEAVDSVLEYIKRERLEQNYDQNLFVLDLKLQRIFPCHRPFTTISKVRILPAVEHLLKQDVRNSRLFSNSSQGKRNQSSVRASGPRCRPQVEPAVIVIDDISDDSSSDKSSQSGFSNLRYTPRRRTRTRSNVIDSDDDDGFGRNGSLFRTKKTKLTVKDDEVLFEREETLDERLERGFIEAMKNNEVIVL